MYEFLKAIAAANGWEFDYGRADFHNLYEGVEKIIPYVFLDPVKIKDNDNDSGVTESKTYSGSFMVVYSSKIDEISYDDRYQKYIKPVLDGAMDTIKTSLRCEYFATFKNWNTTEVINIFDYNFDGIICNYEIDVNI